MLIYLLRASISAMKSAMAKHVIVGALRFKRFGELLGLKQLQNMRGINLRGPSTTLIVLLHTHLLLPLSCVTTA